MDDPLLVSFFEGLSDLSSDLEGFVDGNRAARHSLREILTFNQLQNEEGLAVRVVESVDRSDSRMVQGGEEGGLALEAGEALGVLSYRFWQHLDRDLAAELRVAGAIHLSHPALPERGEDLEDAEAGSGGEGHGLSSFRCRNCTAGAVASGP